MNDVRARLTGLLAENGDAIPLDLGAALLAAEEGNADIDATLVELDRMASGLGALGARPTFDALARLNHHLFETLGFQGDSEEYDKPENSMLDRVLARRRGLPILLSVVYVEVARRAGIEMVGVGFPSHFLVRPRHSDQFFIDPFHQGRILRPEQLQMWLSRLYPGAPITTDLWAQATTIASNREILLRMNRNLKFSYLRREDLAGGARAIERILLLAPELADERRDLGRIWIAMGRRAAGEAELAHYLAMRPDAPDSWQIAAELEFLKRQI